jgi:predicted MFS family arabinose efflux permease
MSKIGKSILSNVGLPRIVLLIVYFILSFFACYHFLQFENFKFYNWFQIYIALTILELISRLISSFFEKKFEWKKMFIVITILSLICLFPVWLFVFSISQASHS